MFRLTLRKKLLTFAIVIAILPLLVAGRTMIRIAQDELKSSANQELVDTANQIGQAIDAVYENTWLDPLLLIRNAVDDERLGVGEKISLLTLGLANIPDIVALQITVEGAELPLVVTQDAYAERLVAAGLEPLEVLRASTTLIASMQDSGSVYSPEIIHLPATDDWLITAVLPLRTKLAGADATLSARIDLKRLGQLVQSHPFNRRGDVTIVDARGNRIFDPERPDLKHYPIVAEAIDFLSAGSRVVGVEPYPRPDGDVMLGAYAFTRGVDWAILVELSQEDAYQVIAEMTDNLIFWGSIGLAVAVAGAAALAVAMSRPILEIDRVAAAVGEGDFSARVIRGARLKDEIGDLARRVNTMIVGLNERFRLEELTKALQQTADELSTRNIQLEAANRTITDSILYASRIQKALLPSEEALSSLADDHFVIWEPRDIVGGDYYWVEDLGDRYLVVVVDCTGHGVPGACMTMIVAAMLDRAVHERGAREPGEILRVTGDLVRRALHQDDPEATSDDGFDAAACMVDVGRGVLDFAGARVPLFTADGGGRVEEIRPSRYSLAYKDSLPTVAIPQHRVPLRSGTSFYLTTDGLSDQVGGPARRMFGKKRIKAVLARYGAEPMSRQAQLILSTLTDYQGIETRRDDLAVVGFRPIP